MIRYDSILASVPSFLKPDDDEERRKILFESQLQAAPPVEPAPSRNAWTDPLFLQAMVPVFTELQGLKAELASYKADEAAAKAEAGPQMTLSDLTMPSTGNSAPAPSIDPFGSDSAAPSAVASPAFATSTPSSLRGGLRLAMNGPIESLLAPATTPPAQPAFRGGIAPADIVFAPQTIQGAGSANATPSPVPAAAFPIPIRRPDWSAQPAASVPIPKPNPFGTTASSRGAATQPGAAATPSLAKPASPGSTASSNAGDIPIRVQDLRIPPEVKIRAVPIQPEVKAVLNYAAAAANVELKVAAGGQYAKDSEQYRRYLVERARYDAFLKLKAEGKWQGAPVAEPREVRIGDATRHDDGFAADVQLVVRDEAGRERKLDHNKPGDRVIMARFVEYAAEAGATGIGAGYMGPYSIHIGFGTPLKWGKRGTNPPGPEWLEAGYAAGEKRRDAFAARNGLKPWLEAVKAAP